MTPKHEVATIYVPVGVVISKTLYPGSGVVGTRMPCGTLVIYYEGNLYGAENMHEGRERVACAFSRLAVQYPTIAKQAVMPDEERHLIPVGEITWPNIISFNSPESEKLFNDYMSTYRRNPA